MIFRRIGLIPIWALTLCLKPFLPQSHPWKHQEMTLRSWWLKGTREAVLMGWVFWLYIPLNFAMLCHFLK